LLISTSGSPLWISVTAQRDGVRAFLAQAAPNVAR
jgi:hypothetical protein